MTELTVRRLLIDLETPFERNWCGGDAFRTAFMNALSMSFPVGEQFFIDSVRHGLKALPEDAQARFREQVQGFVGQEATHRRLHALFNGHLERQGLVNAWVDRSREQLKIFASADPRHGLGATAANEHLTAIFAEWLLTHPHLIEGAPERLRTLWMWHSAEEAEHKSVAFDLYLACGGNHDWRVKWFRRITLVFFADALRQTVENLRREGQLWRWSTLRGAWRLLLGRDGLLRHIARPWLAYLRRDFHPDQLGSDVSARWLHDNAGSYTPVGAAATAG